MQIICMLIYGALAAQAWQLALEKLDRNAFLMEQTSRVSTWPSYFIIPIGFAAVTMLLLAKMILTWMGKPPLAIDEAAEQEGAHV
jgi:TRAP-type C4-dicarboxylate transport system permease small subunit